MQRLPAIAVICQAPYKASRPIAERVADDTVIILSGMAHDSVYIYTYDIHICI